MEKDGDRLMDLFGIHTQTCIEVKSIELIVDLSGIVCQDRDSFGCGDVEI